MSESVTCSDGVERETAVEFISGKTWVEVYRLEDESWLGALLVAEDLKSNRQDGVKGIVL